MEIKELREQYKKLYCEKETLLASIMAIEEKKREVKDELHNTASDASVDKYVVLGRIFSNLSKELEQVYIKIKSVEESILKYFDDNKIDVQITSFEEIMKECTYVRTK